LARGIEIKRELTKRWTPPKYYYHLRPGGHIAALKAHKGQKCFLHLDIQNFFGSINKSRVTRCLKRVVGYNMAREWAYISVVSRPKNPQQKILPYGFVQSQLIASLCLANSALGHCLDEINKDNNEENKIIVTVYVDDIIISTKDISQADSIKSKVIKAAEHSNFRLNPDKEQGPRDSITAFNINISSNHMDIEKERFYLFIEQLKGNKNKYKKQGIIKYVSSINVDQASYLNTLFKSDDLI
jgi:hypothetical protein